MKKLPWRLLGTGLLLFFAFGCEYKHRQVLVLEDCQWARERLLEFPFQITNTTQAYAISLLVKYAPATYPYRNLYVEHHLESAKGILLHQDLKGHLLFDKAGRPLGKGLGNYKEQEILLVDNYRFTTPGRSLLRFKHFMRTEVLEGVYSLGIKITPSKQRSQ